MTAPYELTILFDNYPGLPGFKPLWGFAALIQTPDRTLLFDTGSNGRVLLAHMARLNIAPAPLICCSSRIRIGTISAALDSILELNPRLDLVVHEGFSKHLIRDLETQCRTLHVIGTEPQQLAPGLYSTGMLASEPPEHALLIESPTLVAVISGCAHPGMDQIVAHVTATDRKAGRLGDRRFSPDVRRRRRHPANDPRVASTRRAHRRADTLHRRRGHRRLRSTPTAPRCIAGGVGTEIVSRRCSALV